MSFLFLHIEKCGGMSLRKEIYHLFKNCFNSDNFFIQNYDKIHTEKNYDIDYVITKKIVEWHLFYDSKLNNFTFKITCIRNPVKRLLSHYHYFDKKTHGYESLIEFENKNKEGFDNYIISLGNLQILKLSGYSFPKVDKEILNNCLEKAIKIINTFDYILQLEIINDDLKNMRKILKKHSDFEKINKLKFFKENKTSETYMDFYDEDCLKKYSKYCYYDIFLYNHVCDLKKNNLHIPILNDV